MPFADRAAVCAAVFHTIAAAELIGGKVVVAVHGFNNTIGDGDFVAAQMIRDFEIAGPTFLCASPSGGAPHMVRLRYLKHLAD